MTSAFFITMTNINQVAKKAGVSTATVSRSFRTPQLLSAETRQRVLEAAEQLDYRPRGSQGDDAEEVSNGAREAIGFQFFSGHSHESPPSDAFHAPLLMGAQREAAACGFNLLMHTTDGVHLAQQLPKMVSQRAVDGMLLVGAADNEDALAIFSQYVPHIVLLDNRDPQGKYECVISDDFGGAYRATQFLLELGHRDIGFFLPDAEVRLYQERLHGYAAALLDAGIAPDATLIIGGAAEDSFASRELRLTNLLARTNRPTAMLVASDDHALYLMRTLRRLGLRAPEDISLIGFNDSAFSQHSDPPLTTVKIDLESMGRLAVQRLVARIRAPEGSFCYPAVNLVSASLVVRQSCREPQRSDRR